MKQLLLIMLIGSTPIAAHAEPELSIALKGGPNAATLDHDYRVNRYGLSGGLAGQLQWSLTDQFLLGAQIELLYTPRGTDVVFEGELQARSRQHYFDITIAAHPEARLGPVSMYLLLGAGLNFLVRANDENAVSALSYDRLMFA